MNLGEIIRRHARWTPDKIAVIAGTARASYGDLDRNSERLIAALQALGIAKSDRIATLTDNCAAYFEVVAAAAKAGLVIVPINPRLTAAEIRFILADSGSSALFTSDAYAATVDAARSGCKDLRAVWFIDRAAGEGSYAALLAAAPSPSAYAQPELADLIFISYTSGTTGTPKGAMMSHRNLLANAANVALHFELNATSRFLLVMPQSTAGCNHHIVFPMLYVGGTFVVHDARHFDAERFLATVESERITNTQLVPTQIYRLLDSPALGRHDLSSLRTVGYGSAPMSAERLREAMARFGNVFAQVYGQTECSSLAVFMSRQDHFDALNGGDTAILGSSGRPINSVAVRIVDDQDRDVAVGEVGEILFKGETVTRGYWNAPEASEAALRGGWLHTGDLVREDAAGFIFHVDRKKDIIISGGMNVSGREVEEVIYRHPAVRECAVIGVPDRQWGEAVKALVQLRDQQRVTAEEILELCRRNLAPFKCPKSVDFVDEFIKNSMGKVLKREMKKLYWKDSQRMVN